MSETKSILRVVVMVAAVQAKGQQPPSCRK
jgi:hypothetical protein